MAVPSYTTDMITIATGDLNVDVGTWDESSDSGWDTAGGMVDDQNLYYNNSECVSAQYTKLGNGSGVTGPGTIMYLHTGPFTIPADGAALIHHLWAAPPALNLIDDVTSAGINICIGSSFGDFYAWKASGSDFIPAPRGGWTNYAINPAIGSPDHTVGTAPSTYSMVGIAVSATAQARGNPQACNAIRYGRCEARFTDGDIDNGYCTFSGFAAVDSLITNKWNLIDPIPGGYQTQGLISIGLAGASADFRDSNASLIVLNTINVTPAFNKIEVNNVLTNLEWTAISITALGTVSKGSFEMIDNATVSKVSCTFTDMGLFTYLSGATILSSTYRRTGQITQGGAMITDCLVEDNISTSAILSDNPTLITGCRFESGGTGHAIEINPTGAGPFSFNHTDNSYVGYAVINGSTGNEGVLINPVTLSADITLTVTSGSNPTIMLAAGYTGVFTLVEGTVTVEVTVLDATTGAPITDARVWIGKNSDKSELLSDEADINGRVSFEHTYVSDLDIVGWARQMDVSGIDYVQKDFSGTITDTGFSLTINLERLL